MNLISFNSKSVKYIFVLFFFIFSMLNSDSQISIKDTADRECFMIMAGKAATKDGSILIAHNNDLTGTEVSFCEKIPGKEHSAKDSITFSNGLTIPDAKITFEWFVLRTRKGYKEGDAVAINEHQVAIGGGVSLKRDRNHDARIADPLAINGLPGGVRYVALQRSKTARQCVELIGKLYNKYGIAYPSGVSIGDPEEIWYMETGGGSTWAAVRIPDSTYMVQANGYRIGKININDTANVLTSPGLLNFCEKKGVWNNEPGSINFRKAFGGRTTSSDNPFYNSRREWRGISLLTPSFKLDPDGKDFPMFIKPDEKIDVSKLISLLRDHYQETEYNGYPIEDSYGERLIASPKCVHSDVIQLRRGMTAEIGAIMWVSLSRPYASPYVPFYFGINEIPEAYSGDRDDKNTAFVAYKGLSDLLLRNYEKWNKMILTNLQKFEKINFSLQPATETRALILMEDKKDELVEFLTSYTGGLCRKALRQTGEMIRTIVPPEKIEKLKENSNKSRQRHKK